MSPLDLAKASDFRYIKLVSPQELYSLSREVIRQSNPEGVKPENAAAFIDVLQMRVRDIGTWIPPVYGAMGYADAEIIDRVRQFKLQSEGVIRNFPIGMDALTKSLDQFCLYLCQHYPINKEERPAA